MVRPDRFGTIVRTPFGKSFGTILVDDGALIRYSYTPYESDVMPANRVANYGNVRTFRHLRRGDRVVFRVDIQGKAVNLRKV